MQGIRQRKYRPVRQHYSELRRYDTRARADPGDIRQRPARARLHDNGSDGLFAKGFTRGLIAGVLLMGALVTLMLLADGAYKAIGG